MKSKRKNIPLVRVKGFEGAWELCTLGEHIEDYVEKTTVQNQYPVLTSSQNKGIVRQEDYFANRQVTTDSNIGYFVLPKGFSHIVLEVIMVCLSSIEMIFWIKG